MVTLDMPEKETQRLYLRGMEEEDVCDIHEYCKLSKVTALLNYTPHTDVDDTLDILKSSYLPFEEMGEPQAWCMVEKEIDKVIGHLYFHGLHQHSAQIAYVLHPDFWGKGYVTEALPELLNIGFLQLDLHKVFAYVAVENRKSIRVLERLGFRKMKVLKKAEELSDGLYHDIVEFMMLKDEWRK